MGRVWNVLAPRNIELGPYSESERPDAGVPGASRQWRHWKLVRDDSRIAWLIFDKSGASANTLSEDVFTELNEVLTRIDREPPRGVVLRSGKKSGFIAGADIGEFRGMTDAAAVERRLQQAHSVIDRIDKLTVPIVAVIHGYCLGGGLEIALACDYRIAVEDARLGFPEVMLGLHPGLGGTVRLPRLINPLEAMTMMLTGRNVRASRAKSLGLVDAVVPERHVAAAVPALARRLADAGEDPVVQAAAAWALGRIGTGTAIEALRQACKSTDATVRDAVAAALAGTTLESETGQPGYFLVDFGVVFHRAGSERVKTTVDVVVQGRKVSEMADNIDLGELGERKIFPLETFG